MNDHEDGEPSGTKIRISGSSYESAQREFLGESQMKADIIVQGTKINRGFDLSAPRRLAINRLAALVREAIAAVFRIAVRASLCFDPAHFLVSGFWYPSRRDSHCDGSAN